MWRADGKNCPPDGRLPDGAKGAQHIRDIFYRMGFNDQACYPPDACAATLKQTTLDCAYFHPYAFILMPAVREFMLGRQSCPSSMWAILSTVRYVRFTLKQFSCMQSRVYLISGTCKVSSRGRRKSKMSLTWLLPFLAAIGDCGVERCACARALPPRPQRLRWPLDQLPHHLLQRVL